jgi:hypothetical protein
MQSHGEAKSRVEIKDLELYYANSSSTCKSRKEIRSKSRKSPEGTSFFIHVSARVPLITNKKHKIAIVEAIGKESI